jgi:radical SAM-linked protein
MIRVRLTFQKTDMIRYIGHLDLHHIWIRLFRRARLAVVHSQGFHPQPKFHMASALSLGYTGSNELLEVWLEDDMPLDELRERMQKSMHPGIRIQKMEIIDPKADLLQVRICGALYRVDLPQSALPGLQAKVDALLARDEIMLERKGKQVNIRPFLFGIELDEAASRMDLHLSAGEGTTGKVDEILTLLAIDPLDCLVDRTRIDLKE